MRVILILHELNEINFTVNSPKFMVIFEVILKDKNSLRTWKYYHYNFILSNTGAERTKLLLSAVSDNFPVF